MGKQKKSLSIQEKPSRPQNVTALCSHTKQDHADCPPWHHELSEDGMALDAMLPFKWVVTVRAQGDAKQMISPRPALVKYLIGNREGKSSNRKM